MNKTGKGAGWLAGIFVVMVIAVGGLGYLGYTMTQQSAVATEPASVEEVAKSTAAGLKTGDAATVKTRDYDYESNGKSQVAGTLYMEEWNGDGVGKGDFKLIESGTAMSATAATSTATSIGANLKICAFDATYYADCKEVKVAKETEPIDLVGHAIAVANRIKFTCYDNGVALGTPSHSVDNTVGGCNLSLSADQTDAFDYIKIEINASDVSYRLKMLGFDTNATTQINDIEMTGALAWESNGKGEAAPGTFVETSKVPKILNNQLNYVFELPAAVTLHEFDSVRTPAIKIQAKGTNPGIEVVNVFILDESYFKSVADTTTNRILAGVENDQSSAGDVGGFNANFSMSIN